MNHTTGAQRHNKRQDKIWETYKQQEEMKKEAMELLVGVEREKKLNAFLHEIGAIELLQTRVNDMQFISHYQANGRLILVRKDFKNGVFTGFEIYLPAGGPVASTAQTFESAKAYVYGKPCIIVDVRGGVAYCGDERVQIIDHDNKELDGAPM